MKKILFFATMAVALLLTSCGGSGNSGGSSSSATESEGSVSGLKDGQWPAAVYDKYGISELKTAGKIVFTQFDEDDSYQYQVYFKGVTREELQAWVGALKEKGFRLEDRDQERIDKSAYDHDIMIYQPEECKDMCMRVSFDFKDDMSFEYYADEPNPAFEVTTRTDENGDEHMDIVYNAEVSLRPLDNAKKVEGSVDFLELKAEDFAQIPNVRVATFAGGGDRFGLGLGFYADHQLTEADLDALHGGVADVLASKGATFSNALSGKAYTADELKANKVRTYNVEKDGQKYLMMVNGDNGVGDFGGGFNYNFTKVNR